MRINKYIAASLGVSRRAADELIMDGQIQLNGKIASPGDQVGEFDSVTRGADTLALPSDTRMLVMLNKPTGFICSHKQQGRAKTVFDLLPPEYRRLNTVGRLDKDSSGLLLLTNDGDLLYELTHPKFIKDKVYEVTLNIPLEAAARQAITTGVELDDGLSVLQLHQLGDANHWRVTMHEGRNRQIRRTFDAVGTEVTALHRIQFGDYALGSLASGAYKIL